MIRRLLFPRPVTTLWRCKSSLRQFSGTGCTVKAISTGSESNQSNVFLVFLLRYRNT
jgi:hypothetical protein